jgi:hypothetical protein
MPAHYTIRTDRHDPGSPHLKSWVVETSADGKSWREVDREEDNKQFNGAGFTGTFAVAGGGECRFIRLVNIGWNHGGKDQLSISVWEIFGSLIESTDSSDFSDVTSLPFLSAASFGSFHRIPFPASHPRPGRQDGPIDGPRPSSHTGAIAFPAGRPPQRNVGNQRGLDDPLLPWGFDLVVRVTSKLITSRSNLRTPSPHTGLRRATCLTILTHWSTAMVIGPIIGNNKLS